jgi:Fe2+ transport system protein FeoA
MQCKLCGFEFDADVLACHTGCPFGEKCALICCPNCGYQVVDDRRSVVARFLERITGIGKKSTPTQPSSHPEGLVPLTHIANGKSAVVRDVSRLSGDRKTRLGLFGLAPGAVLFMIQRAPAPVIRIGETELALEIDVLQQIWVEPEHQHA